MTQPYRPLVLALAALLPAAAAAQTREPAPDVPVVVTAGEGIVHAVPDRAFVSVTAEARAANPREAQRRNVEQMKPVLDKLRAAGIPDEAIRTTAYELQIEYDYVRDRRVPKGYLARNTIDVRVDAVDRLGEILDVAVSAGATSVGGVRFDLRDRAKLERDALRRAVEDARARADSAAAGTGQTIARVLRIEEQGIVAPPVPMMRQTMTVEAEAAASDVPIAAGQIELRARVTLTCQLK